MKDREIAPTVPVLLVIDDDPAVRSSLKFSLQVEGFVVRAYASGCELLNEHQFPLRGCLIIDYHMPGINGLELLAMLRQRGVALPAIIITTTPSPALRRRVEGAGALVVEKPLLGNALIECIRAVLGREAS